MEEIIILEEWNKKFKDNPHRHFFDADTNEEIFIKDFLPKHKDLPFIIYKGDTQV